MKTAAVICEFNPFHNGHAYLMSRLRREYNVNYIIAIMSGNYVQRGEPAIFDKYVRAEAALRGDGEQGYADAVIELPTLFSTASAGDFAAAGVITAIKTGVTDMLAFGVEDAADLDKLKHQAELMGELKTEAGDNSGLRELLAKGMSYPEAAAAYLSDDSISYASNNILAAEYLTALKQYDIKQQIEPLAVPRLGDSYNSTEITDTRFCSASALRRHIFEAQKNSCSKDSLALLTNYVPDCTYMRTLAPVHPDILSGLLSKALLEAKYRELKLTEYLDVSQEIANRLIKSADQSLSFTDRIVRTKTRQYTYTRISRSLLHTALGMSREEQKCAKSAGYISCLRLLGFRRSSAPLLKAISENASVPLISKTADYTELLKSELYYSGLYYALTGGRSEFERSPVIVQL